MYVIGVFDDPNKDLDNIKEEKVGFQKIMGKLQMGEDFKYEIFEGNSLEALMDRIDELKDVLNWFHFSGHHDKNEGIRLNDGNFSSLIEHLKNCKNLKGVFINGCASESTLEKLKGIVPIYIGTYKPVSDGLATKFSEKFYQKLADLINWSDYHSIYKAFELTKTQINDLLKTKNGIEGVNLRVRGGGSLKELEDDDNLYFISKEDKIGKKKFEEINVKIDPIGYVRTINEHLTKQLISVVQDQDKPKRFLESIPSEDLEAWETKPDHLKKAQGIFNVSSCELLSIYDMAIEVATIFNLDASFVKRISTSELNQKAVRPPITGFDLTKSNKILELPLVTFTERLQVFKNQLEAYSVG